MTPAASSTTAEWRPFLTEELKADPVVSGWAEKASEKDIPALIKSYAHVQKRMGSAINLPGKDAKPEEVQALRQKLYEAGVFTAPPAQPDEYGLTKPDALPEGVQWNEALAGKFAAALHKHGVPKAAVADLLPLYLDAVGGSAGAIQSDRESGLTVLKQEFGEQFDERMELATRMAGGIFKSEEELALFNRLGLANDPRFLGPMLRLSALAAQDSSFIESLPVQGGQITGESATAEYAKVLNDTSHPHYEGFRRGDKAALAYVDDLYRRAYGTQKVSLDQGVSV